MLIDSEALSFARRLAHIKAAQLKRRLVRTEREDLEQELLLEVIDGWKRYDPARGRTEPFIERLVARRAWQLLRDRRLRSRTFRFDDSRVQEAAAPRRELDAIDARIDIRDVVESLDPLFRTACANLDHQSVSTAARAMGIPRSTLDSWLAKVRATFTGAGLNPHLR